MDHALGLCGRRDHADVAARAPGRRRGSAQRAYVVGGRPGGWQRRGRRRVARPARGPRDAEDLVVVRERVRRVLAARDNRIDLGNRAGRVSRIVDLVFELSRGAGRHRLERARAASADGRAAGRRGDYRDARPVAGGTGNVRGEVDFCEGPSRRGGRRADVPLRLAGRVGAVGHGRAGDWSSVLAGVAGDVGVRSRVLGLCVGVGSDIGLPRVVAGRIRRRHVGLHVETSVLPAPDGHVRVAATGRDHRKREDDEISSHMDQCYTQKLLAQAAAAGAANLLRLQAKDPHMD